MANTIQSVDRALNLLLEVSKAGGKAVGVRELARRTSLKAPTAHDLLRTLMARGFLAFDNESRGYRLGRTAMDLGRGSDPLRALVEAIRPGLVRLHARLGETVTVMAHDGTSVVVLDGIQADHALAVVPGIGPAQHPHRMATGLVTLAYQDKEVHRNYVGQLGPDALGPESPRNRQDLLDLLDQVRKRGWAEAVNVKQSGIGAVAVPVFNAEGRFVFGIGCSAPLSRFRTPARKAARKALLEAAADFGKQMSTGVAPDRSRSELEPGSPTPVFRPRRGRLQRTEHIAKGAAK
ncbi:MAG: IclR family transcriptional regulator [Kiritimatiellia bacterium]|nr:IclR family transcriptional regulator [Kiritimatiellia bacterium]